MKLDKWDKRFMRLAREVASWSKDRSTKVGCVVIEPGTRAIVSVGYNGIPRGVDDDDEKRHQRPTKYFWFEHAERNAVFNAAMRGTTLRGCTIYVTMYPCADCARAIIQSGISKLVCPAPDFEVRGDWADSWRIASKMFGEAKVFVGHIKKKKYRGKHFNRTCRNADNPRELAFAKAWAETNESNQILAHLLGDGMRCKTPTSSEYELAATLVQWFGSTVGYAWLTNVYDLIEKSERRR